MTLGFDLAGSSGKQARSQQPDPHHAQVDLALKSWLDNVIVPALVRSYLSHDNQETVKHPKI